MITYDTLGFGRSANPAGVLSHNQLADDTAALPDALGLQRPFVGGWSDGEKLHCDSACAIRAEPTP